MTAEQQAAEYPLAHAEDEETMFDDDYTIDDLPCPACGHGVTHSDDCQDCDEFGEVVECCDDICVGSGHCIHGDGMAPCRECYGTGIRRWCPKCGENYWPHYRAKVKRDRRLAGEERAVRLVRPFERQEDDAL